MYVCTTNHSVISINVHIYVTLQGGEPSRENLHMQAGYLFKSQQLKKKKHTHKLSHTIVSPSGVRIWTVLHMYIPHVGCTCRHTHIHK